MKGSESPKKLDKDINTIVLTCPNHEKIELTSQIFKHGSGYTKKSIGSFICIFPEF